MSRLEGIKLHSLVEMVEREQIILNEARLSEERAEELLALAVWTMLGLTPAQKKALRRKYFPANATRPAWRRKARTGLNRP